MLKSTLSVVLGRSATLSYGSQYASASELPVALLNDRFEHAAEPGDVTELLMAES